MSSSSAVKLCTVCGKENAKNCARCKSTSYCSKACQQDDWSTHKLLCASFPTFATTNRPTPDHYRGALFDPDKRKPEFIWLLCKRITDFVDDYDDEGSYQMPETDTFLGSDTKPRHAFVQYNPRLEKTPSDTVVVTYRDTFGIDGSRPNKCVASITALQPGEYHDWRGPIVAYVRKGSSDDPPACKDFDMIDFRHATDYFLSYAYKPPRA